MTVEIRKRPKGVACRRGYKSKPWTVIWQSAIMAAPAFWYCKTKKEAETVAEGLR